MCLPFLGDSRASCEIPLHVGIGIAIAGGSKFFKSGLRFTRARTARCRRGLGKRSGLFSPGLMLTGLATNERKTESRDVCPDHLRSFRRRSVVGPSVGEDPARGRGAKLFRLFIRETCEHCFPCCRVCFCRVPRLVGADLSIALSCLCGSLSGIEALCQRPDLRIENPATLVDALLNQLLLDLLLRRQITLLLATSNQHLNLRLESRVVLLHIVQVLSEVLILRLVLLAHLADRIFGRLGTCLGCLAAIGKLLKSGRSLIREIGGGILFSRRAGSGIQLAIYSLLEVVEREVRRDRLSFLRASNVTTKYLTLSLGRLSARSMVALSLRLELTFALLHCPLIQLCDLFDAKNGLFAPVNCAKDVITRGPAPRRGLGRSTACPCGTGDFCALGLTRTC